MNKRTTLPGNFRAFSLICCCTVLISACGGQSSEKEHSQHYLPQVAVASTTDSSPDPEQFAPATAELPFEIDPSVLAFEQMGAAPVPREQQIRDLYWWILGRGADEEGVQHWLASPLSIEQIAFNLKGSAELIGLHGWEGIGINTRNKIYVDASATGRTPNGSIDNPYRTLAEAARAVKPSTTIYVRPGTYEGGFRTTTHGTPSVGNVDNGIYWISTVRWGAKIEPAPRSTRPFDATTAWTNTGDYVQILGFEVDGSKSRDTTSYNNWRQGIYTSGYKSVVRDNYVHDVARWAPCTGAGGAAINIDAYQRGGKGEAVGNWVQDIGHTGTGCNRIQGIYISSSGRVVNNVVYRAIAGGALHLYHDARDVDVIGNTVAASGFGIVVAAGGSRAKDKKTVAENIRVLNNIAYDNYYGVVEFVDSKTNGQMGINYYRNNLVTKNKLNWHGMRNAESNTQTRDPAFVGYANNKLLANFHLASGSGAIGNASLVGAYPTDFDGRERTGEQYCIGAYEYDD